MKNLCPRRRRSSSSLAGGLFWLATGIVAVAQQESGKLDIMNCLSTGSSPVSVSSVYLTCDSPGAYYYGSTTYRDSPTCKYGDTARVKAYVEVKRDFYDDGISVSVDAGVYGVLSSVVKATDLCAVSQMYSAYNTTTSDDNGDDNVAERKSYCGMGGFYQVKTYFTLELLRDANFHYIPDLRLRFYNTTTSRVIGCSMSGTISHVAGKSTHAEAGLLALGIALLVLGTCFGLMLYLTYRRKKRLEVEVKARRLEFDFPYVRTTRTGRVIPTDGRSSVGSKSSHSSSSPAISAQRGMQPANV